MKYLQTPVSLVVLLLILGSPAPLHSQDLLQISEFMAVNDRGLDDEDRDEEDWIEIHNAGTRTVSLNGWYLTDSSSNLTKWQFPAVALEPDGYLVVFASGKDRSDPAGELHTNFKLSGAGEYLGLVRPDGVTVVSEYSPAYPAQAPDVSYGLVETIVQEPLVAQGAMAKALVPLDDLLEPPSLRDAPRPWTLEDFDDASWQSGVTGIGFGYLDSIGLDVSHMRYVNETVYIRIPFFVEDPSAFRMLTLRMQFDDGIIAYLNGHEVARDNAPEPATETWNSGALASYPNARFVDPVDFTIRQVDYLHVGMNLLAIQGLNYGADSPDLLVIPELLANLAGVEPSRRYFPEPTPGAANSDGVETVGPIIADVGHSPEIPTRRDILRVTARITPAFDAIALAELHYRVMFGPDVVIPLLDDGNTGEGTGGDGVFGARLPGGVFTAGDMVRWYIIAVDAAGRVSRWPAFRDLQGCPQYEGTVVDDPSLTNPLPVLHWFIQEPTAANTDTGTRCSLFYDGHFYDNLWITIHGQSSRGFPKKSYNIDFNPGYNFRWSHGQPRVGDINLLTTYPDKAQMRNILAYETYRDADCPGHWAFAVRVQQNGVFWGTAHIVENGDKDWLVRMGLNAEGALYKMYNGFTSTGDATSGAEKKTRKNEDNTDLLALFNGISLSGETRRRYLYDNVDIAQVVNFLAARLLTGDTDCCHKNYYFYRDTGGSDEWQMWPWDVDLSFGRRWISSMTYWDQRLIANTPLFIGSGNRLPQALFDTPEMRQMYLRRVRTLMDELLMPPGTPVEALHYEPRIDELAAQIGPDANLDAAKWNSHAWGNGSTAPNYPQPFAEAVAEMRDSYLPERRRQLFNRLAPGAAEIPAAQPAGTVILFGDIEGGFSSRNQDEEYIQLVNPNSYAADISGWALSVDTAPEAPLFTFRGGTVIPAGGTLYVAASRTAFRARASFPTGGQGLFVVGDYTGRLSSQSQTLTLIDRQGLQVALTSIR
ncbi:MAG: CotH kinase family protein [Phycisphaerales bacterium]